MAERLAGKVAVVTGSTSGIGRGTATLFAREGARVVVNGRRAELGQQVVDEIRAAGGEAVYFQADVGQSDQLKALIQHAVDTYGRLDILMNNAHSGPGGKATDLAEEAWDASLRVSLRGAFLGSKYAIPHMVRGGGGSIINISSIWGVRGGAGNIAYATAKGGMLNMTRQLAVDYGPQNIRVNAICPGWILVEKTAERLQQDPEALRRGTSIYPLRRAGTPIDIAYAAVFLGSDESQFITGNILMVDGGVTAQLAEVVIPTLGDYYRDLHTRDRQ